MDFSPEQKDRFLLFSPISIRRWIGVDDDDRLVVVPFFLALSILHGNGVCCKAVCMRESLRVSRVV